MHDFAKAVRLSIRQDKKYFTIALKLFIIFFDVLL